jgi:PTH1 family peptidyl-tRNA hydrolase
MVSRFLNTRLEDPDLLLVVCDDINLPLGTLRIRKKGGSGGHNGLKSVAHNLGTDEFGRIRTGVGTPSPHEDTADYVLSRVPEKEMEFLRKVESRAAEAVLFIAENGWESAMAKFNGKVGLPEI